MMRRGLLLDVDGTLVDTTYLHVTAWWEAFDDEGLAVGAREIHRSIGLGAEALVARLAPDADEGQQGRLVAGHTERYRGFLPRVRPLPGARDLVRGAAAGGMAVALASSASAEESERFTEVLDLDDVLAAVTTSADTDEAKPAPDVLAVAMERAGLRPEECLMVGDTVWDVRAAERAGVPCVGVLTGGVGADELREAGAVAVHDGPVELLAALASLRAA